MWMSCLLARRAAMLSSAWATWEASLRRYRWTLHSADWVILTAESQGWYAANQWQQVIGWSHAEWTLTFTAECRDRGSSRGESPQPPTDAQINLVSDWRSIALIMKLWSPWSIYVLGRYTCLNNVTGLCHFYCDVFPMCVSHDKTQRGFFLFCFCFLASPYVIVCSQLMWRLKAPVQSETSKQPKHTNHLRNTSQT